MADSVPAETLREWEFERERIRKLEAESGKTSETEEAKRLFSETVECYLDSGYGSCMLREPAVAETVISAWKHFNGEKYHIHAHCVMPNHVHVVVEPLGDNSLSSILHSWKSYTSNEINKLTGNSGTLWQSESYDRIIRSEAEYSKQVEYVLSNPTRAGMHQWTWVGESFDRLEACSTESLREAIRIPTDERLWAIAEGLRRGWGVDEVNKLCRVDKWFLRKMLKLVEEEPVFEVRGYKMVDTCAGEFESKTPYYYSTTESDSDLATP
ncbi:MAG: transposase [Fimbriimonadaceae bacterium]